MPWKETCAVQQRNSFVHDVLMAVANKAELCRRYGICGRWFNHSSSMHQEPVTRTGS